MCDDGTLMLDETIRRCGVGQYFAGWERIEAEWYISVAPGLKKVELQQVDGRHEGFAIAQTGGAQEAKYPHVYGILPDSTLSLRVKEAPGAAIEVLADDAALGTVPADAPDFHEVSLPLGDPAGEHDLTLRLTGCITLDWFHISAN